jgi:hypothetical protein
MSDCTDCGYAMAAGDAFCAGCGHAQPAAAPITVPAWARPEPATVGATTGTSPGQNTGGAPATGSGYHPAPAGGAPGAAPAALSMPRRADEGVQLKYMRQTRTACVFIAVMVAIYSALLLIGVIYTLVEVNSVENSLNNGFGNLGTSSNCQSQGGTNPDC